MSTEKLEKARAYEKKVRLKAASFLPVFHLTGGAGWINDPNGFAPYKGEYHLFFQYYPYDVKWGPMHWGHAKTKDFIRWEFLPAALAPDEEYDRDGCFSGGAVEMPDGRHLLMYTGLRCDEIETGQIKIRQTQCIAFGDGTDYVKYPHNPVLTAEDLPEGGSPVDFRDPKIWLDGDKLMAAIVNRGSDGSGEVLLYESADGIHWKLCGTVASCEHKYGSMWECPDLFKLDGKDVLIHSAQEMLPEGIEYHGGNGKICHVGLIDEKTGRLEDENVHAMEYGLDFYAPQTLLTSDGRRVMVAWMQSWESSSSRVTGMPFLGMMTLPRELHVKNNRVCQWPVREIERYRESGVTHTNLVVKEEMSLEDVEGRLLDLLLHIRPLNGVYDSFTIKVAKDEKFFTAVTLCPHKNMIRIDRTYSGYPCDVLHVREVPVEFADGDIKLRLVMDLYSIELFAGEGEQAASCVIYTPQTACGISFTAEKAAQLDVTAYPLVFETAD